MKKTGHPPPYFELNPSIVFSETSMMETKSDKWDYIASIMKAWVDMDIDNMPYWMVENMGRVRDISEVRARSAMKRWTPTPQIEMQTDANAMQMHTNCNANAMQTDANAMQPSLVLSSLVLSSLNSSSKRKNKINTYSQESVQLRIAISMNHVLKETHGDAWKDRNESDLQGWADDIDKMHRIDKVPYSMIWGWFVACTEDGFWKGTILCPAKLRKQVSKNGLMKIKDKAIENAHPDYDEEENAQGT